MCHIQIWYNQFDFQANQLTTTKNWFEHGKNDGAFEMQNKYLGIHTLQQQQAFPFFTWKLCINAKLLSSYWLGEDVYSSLCNGCGLIVKWHETRASFFLQFNASLYLRSISCYLVENTEKRSHFVFHLGQRQHYFSDSIWVAVLNNDSSSK